MLLKVKFIPDMRITVVENDFILYNTFNMNYKIITFGCQMNVHESEKIAGILSSLGYNPTENEENADIIVFNTCAIRDTAEQHALGQIGAVKPLKKLNKNLIVIVAGCMSEQDGVAEKLKKKFPFVDVVLGTSNIHTLGQKIALLLENGKKTVEVLHLNLPEIVEDTPILRTSTPNAWVNIMYGCNNFCSYCIVPFVRGRERSRDPHKIIEEVRALLDEGYREITLLGQNVNSYRPFEDGSWDFKRLIGEIAALPYKFRLRFMTSHPKDFDEQVIEVIKKYPNICNNIHLPVQAGSNAVLKAMNRRYTRERYLQLVDTIKKELPNVGITTDIMVGFPGETEEDFAETIDLVENCRFSNAFTFIYSVRKGTVAEKMEQIPYEIKQNRIKRLIELQNSITKEESKKYIGGIYEVLAEDVSPKFEGSLCGRTESGRLVTFKADKNLLGKFLNVKINEARSASLFGEVVD